MEGKIVPKSLSYWFVTHFIIDIALAIPLMLFPEQTLEFFGWETVDPILSRVVAAALFGIGIESLLARNAPLQSFRNMLDLKIIWSTAAIVGIGWAMIEGAQGRPLMGWGILATFMVFNMVWWYWKIRVKKMLS